MPRRPLNAAALFLAFLSPARAWPFIEPAPGPIVITAPRVNPSDSRIGLAPRPLLETPASVSVFSRELLDDQGARGAADALGNDASVNENYAPLGYYESFSIRGFTLDNASGFKRNGLTVANESSMPLENKERVEIIKGVAGFEAGMAAPGGIVNYATTQPTATPTRRVALELGGSGARYANADLAGRFAKGRFGYRLNAARESFRPYVKEAVGDREFLGALLDWRLGERALLSLDADWQRKSQLSVPAYQPLGANAIPGGVRPEKMLNNQPWSAPVSITAANLGGAFQYRASADWMLRLSANHNRLLSDDNAAFPYGCSSGPVYLNTFCANGDYDLYDYRSPTEARAATHAQAVLSGRDTVLGLARFNRTVRLGQEVYEYVGTDNIYNPAPLAFPASARAPGPAHLVQDYAEHAVFARHALSLSRHWKVHGGFRLMDVSDRHFSKQTGAAVSRSRRSLVSPQLALTFMPRPDLMAYAGYSEGLELGGTAGATAANAGQTHGPKVSKQAELGVKREFSKRFSVDAALFHIRKPHEFVDPGNVFVQRGIVKHEGLELAFRGGVTDRLRASGGATMIKARQESTGTPEFDGKAPLNVPWLRAQASLDYSLAHAPGAAVNGSWAYVSNRYALRDNTLSVPGYHRFDVGGRYARGAFTWRFRVENALDAVYWKDVGQYLGDGYLHLGAPRTFSLSAQIDF